VMGPSGCGKSTLLNVIGMLDRPSEGEYLFMGEDVAGYGERRLSEIRKQNIGFIFQNFNLIDELSVQENIRFIRDFLGTSTRSCEEVIREVGLTRVAEQQARNLSAGQRKRCALARLLVSDSRLWLLDEPYSNLDQEGVELVDRILNGHLESGGACVLATHGAHRPQWEGTQDYYLVSGAAA